MRAILALSALLVVQLLAPGRPVGLVHASLVAYLLYGIVLLATERRGKPLVHLRVQPWLDALFYAYLVALTGGAGSPFVYFFFFAILAASLSSGFREGLGLTLLCVALFTTLEGGQAPIAAFNLLVLGSIIAYAGGRQVASRRRAEFLGVAKSAIDPRLGADDALTEKLRLLCKFFAAQACIVVRKRPDSGEYAIYRVDAFGEVAAQAPKPMTGSAAAALLELPRAMCIAWSARRPRLDASAGQCRRLANLLETPHFTTVPYRLQGEIAGRLYLIGQQPFQRGETGFLSRAADEIAAAVDRHAASDALKIDAVRAERMRSARDIHDTAIQPYIGLKFGLEALYRTLDPNAAVAQRVKELIEMATVSVEDLRDYVARLRSGESAWSEGGLANRLRAQAEHYREFWGIEVELQVEPDLKLNDRLAGEAYQLACEALSNLRRHTDAKRAFVELRREQDLLLLEVGNERCRHSPTTPFAPRSITERAAALGGKVEVRIDNDGDDVVRITVPAQQS